MATNVTYALVKTLYMDVYGVWSSHHPYKNRLWDGLIYHDTPSLYHKKWQHITNNMISARKPAACRVFLSLLKLLLLVSTLLIVHSYLEWWSSICPFNVSLCFSQKGSNNHPFPFHHPSFLIVFASLPYTKSLEKTPAQNSSWLGSQILWVQRSAGLWPDQGWPGSMTGQGWPGNMCILWKLNMKSLHITASTVIITLLRS